MFEIEQAWVALDSEWALALSAVETEAGLLVAPWQDYCHQEVPEGQESRLATRF